MGAKNHDTSTCTWLAHPTDATYVANDLIQINAFVSEQGYYELGWGYLWTSGLCGPSGEVGGAKLEEIKYANILPGAPFSLLHLNKLNNNSWLGHLSGPLLGPLSQILRESVRSRLSSDLNFSKLGVTIIT